MNKVDEIQKLRDELLELTNKSVELLGKLRVIEEFEPVRNTNPSRTKVYFDEEDLVIESSLRKFSKNNKNIGQITIAHKKLLLLQQNGLPVDILLRVRNVKSYYEGEVEL